MFIVIMVNYQFKNNKKPKNPKTQNPKIPKSQYNILIIWKLLLFSLSCSRHAFCEDTAWWNSHLFSPKQMLCL